LRLYEIIANFFTSKININFIKIVLDKYPAPAYNKDNKTLSEGVYLMNVYDILQLVGGMILSVGAIPQIEQIIRTKSVKDINLTSIITLIVGMVLMQIYAVHYELVMFIITNSVSLLLSIVKLGLKIYYEPKKEAPPTK